MSKLTPRTKIPFYQYLVETRKIEVIKHKEKIISLRLKLILFLCFIFLASLGGGIGFTYQQFHKNEQLKAQELLLSRAQDLREQLNEKAILAATLNNVLYKKWRSQPVDTVKIVARQTNILMFSVVRSNHKHETVYVDKILNPTLEHSPIFDMKRLKTLPARILVNLREIQEKEILTIPSGYLTGTPSILQIQKHSSGHYSTLVMDISTLAAQLSKDRFFDNVILHQNGKAFIGSRVLEKDNVSRILGTTLPLNSIKVESQNGLLHQSYAKDDATGIIGVASLKDNDLQEPYFKIMKKSLALSLIGFCLAILVLVLVTGEWNNKFLSLIKSLKEISSTGALRNTVPIVKGELSLLSNEITKISFLLSETINKKLEQEIKHQTSSQLVKQRKELSNLIRPSGPGKSSLIEVASGLILSTTYSGGYCDHIQTGDCTTIFQFRYDGTPEESLLALGHLKTAIGLFKNLPTPSIDRCIGLLNQSFSTDVINASKLKILVSLVNHKEQKLTILNCGLHRPFLGFLETPQNLKGIQEASEPYYNPAQTQPHKIQTLALAPGQIVIFPLLNQKSEEEQKLLLQAFLRSFQGFQSLPISSSKMEKLMSDKMAEKEDFKGIGFSIMLVKSNS